MVYYQDLDEYRICKKIFPGSTDSISGINYGELKYEIANFSKKYLRNGTFMYAKVSEFQMMNETMDLLKLGQNLRKYDLGEGSMIYTIAGVRRPKLYLKMKVDKVELHLKNFIFEFMRDHIDLETVN